MTVMKFAEYIVYLTDVVLNVCIVCIISSFIKKRGCDESCLYACCNDVTALCILIT